MVQHLCNYHDYYCKKRNNSTANKQKEKRSTDLPLNTLIGKDAPKNLKRRKSMNFLLCIKKMITNTKKRPNPA